MAGDLSHPETTGAWRRWKVGNTLLIEGIDWNKDEVHWVDVNALLEEKRVIENKMKQIPYLFIFFFFLFRCDKAPL